MPHSSGHRRGPAQLVRRVVATACTAVLWLLVLTAAPALTPASDGAARVAVQGGAQAPSSSPRSKVQPSPTGSPLSPGRVGPEVEQAKGPGTGVWPGDWSQLVPTLLATAIGAGLALWAAMKVERAVEARAALATSRERREELVDLLSLLEEELQRQVKATPDATLAEHCTVWSAAGHGPVSTATMSRQLARQDLPLKKRP